MARVVGLDIGESTVKAVVAVTAFRTTQWEAEHQVSRGTPEDPKPLVDALRELRMAVGGHVDVVVTCLPGSGVATHIVELPFTDLKKIDAALPFELDGQMALELDEVVYDFQPVRQTPATTKVLVGVAKKTAVGELLETLRAAEWEARMVLHPALALEALRRESSVFAVESGQSAGILDIGHDRTLFYLSTPDGEGAYARVLPFGSRSFTRALASDFSIPLGAAGSWKEEHGAVGPTALQSGGDAARAGQVMQLALQPLLRELKASLKQGCSHLGTEPPQIFLTGGGAKLRGLVDVISAETGCRAALLRLDSVNSKDHIAAGNPTFALAQALCLRASNPTGPGLRVNFRRGDFAYQSNLDVVRKRSVALGAMAAALFLLFIVGSIARSAELRRRENVLDATLCTLTHTLLGACEKDYARAKNLLAGKESASASLPKHSATAVLADLTNLLATAGHVTASQIVVDLDRVSLRCETEGTNQVVQVVESVKKHPCFKKVNEGKIEKNRDGKGVSFRLEVEVDCPDEHSSAETGSPG